MCRMMGARTIKRPCCAGGCAPRFCAHVVGPPNHRLHCRVSPFRKGGLRGISPFAIRLLTGLNDYLNATSSLTSRKANTQTETMLPMSQPPKASLNLPSSPAKRRGVEELESATGNRPLPGPLSRRGISTLRPIRSLFVPNKKRIRPEPSLRKKSKAHPVPTPCLTLIL